MTDMTMMRQTKQRQAVVAVLESAHGHPDAAWVYQEVRKLQPNISLGTVYRTLDALVKDGLLSTIEQGSGPTCYDYHHGHRHHHAVCECCGAIFDVEIDLLSLLPAGALPEGFALSDICLSGRCADCQKRGGE